MQFGEFHFEFFRGMRSLFAVKKPVYAPYIAVFDIKKAAIGDN